MLAARESSGRELHKTPVSLERQAGDVINNQPNGLNINLNAGSTHIEGLQKFVVEKGLDIGFAYDGDADRCLCVDEKGNVITGDHILYIYRFSVSVASAYALK